MGLVFEPPSPTLSATRPTLSGGGAATSQVCRSLAVVPSSVFSFKGDFSPLERRYKAAVFKPLKSTQRPAGSLCERDGIHLGLPLIIAGCSLYLRPPAKLLFLQQSAARKHTKAQKRTHAIRNKNKGCRGTFAHTMHTKCRAKTVRPSVRPPFTRHFSYHSAFQSKESKLAHERENFHTFHLLPFPLFPLTHSLSIISLDCARAICQIN